MKEMEITFSSKEDYCCTETRNKAWATLGVAKKSKENTRDSFVSKLAPIIFIPNWLDYWMNTFPHCDWHYIGRMSATWKTSAITVFCLSGPKPPTPILPPPHSLLCKYILYEDPQPVCIPISYYVIFSFTERRPPSWSWSHSCPVW